VGVVVGQHYFLWIKKSCGGKTSYASLILMTRLFSLFAIAGLALVASTSNALAIAGGPFDNGLPSAGLDNGVYVANLKFRNGNGYCYFHPEADFTNLTNGLLENRGSIRNRSILYYKGVTYMGAAFGMADPEAQTIQCTINASSEASITQTNTQQQSNFFNFSQSSVTLSAQVVSSARNFTVNGNWEGKFNKTAPVLRFTGKGELAFLSPANADAISNLALTSFANFISAINAYYAGGAGNAVGTPDFRTAQEAIANALNAIPPFLAGAGVESAYKNAERERVFVRGTFRYL
jgi:hypothetical protein